MKSVLLTIFSATISATIFFAASALAQDQDIASAMSACGPKDVRLAIKPDPTQHSRSQPEAGKALAYVIEDDGAANNIIGAGVTVKVGVDGAWVGAINRHNYHISLSLSPGEHHLCTNWQSRFDYQSKAVSLAHFNAEAGKVYYFRIREFGEHEIFFDLDAIDSDQGKLLIASHSMSGSAARK
ncbi:MAG TPA: hypothetical protein VJ999_08865 [Candidatus Sulfotelmatobacter sp.]|nr:hypothetical protein [Candidatus Sulfotelmatobacter sp.]